MIRPLRAVTLALLLAALSACATVSELPLSPFNKRLPFELTVEDRPQLAAELSAELIQYRKSLQTAQFSQPRKIAYMERQLLDKKLKAEGYYRATLRTYVDAERLHHQIRAGRRYRIDEVRLQAPPQLALPAGVSGLSSGQPLLASAVLEAVRRIRTHLENNACLFRVTVDYRVRLDHDHATAEVLLNVAPSPQVRFGEIGIEGLGSVEASYLLARLPFKPGDCFRRKALDRARLKLLQTYLVASVSIVEGEADGDRVPVTLKVTERAHRTLAAGAGFQSDEGFGVSAGWEHRNLLGRGQKFELDAHLAEQARRLASSLTFPHLGRDNQALTVYGEFSSENPDAYESESGTGGVELTRQINPHLRAVVGAELSFSRVTEDDTSEDYALLSMPMTLELDQRNDELDPTRGWVAAINLRPYWDAYDTGTRFLHSSLAASLYWSPAITDLRPTLGLRGALGTITGIERDEVPANVRFYSGGGGSVRGYAFQLLGPLEDDDPVGGLSFGEVSAELRLRFADNWGSVLFLDGGSAYASATPEFGRDFRWGTGIGLRYYTSIAPIRFDLAFPLQRRRDLDDSFQVYISIGQAF